VTGSICQRAVDCAASVKSDYRTVEPRIEGVDHGVSLALTESGFNCPILRQILESK
jgi:hypothetical protein